MMLYLSVIGVALTLRWIELSSKMIERRPPTGLNGYVVGSRTKKCMHYSCWRTDFEWDSGKRYCNWTWKFSLVGRQWCWKVKEEGVAKRGKVKERIHLGSGG